MQRTCFIIIFLVFLVNGSPAGHHNRHQGHRHRKNHQEQKRTLPPNIWALLEANKSARDEANSSKYNKNIETTHDNNEIADESNFGTSNGQDDDSMKKVNCPKCKQNSVKMSEDELANLRIEYVKNQILHKLRMDERPAPVMKDELPEPIQEGYAVSSAADHDDEFLNRHLDDYFAKTTQKVIFLTKGKY